MNKLMLFGITLLALFIFASCEGDAQVASKNLSRAADMFEIQRRIVFVNGITDKYVLVIEGRCSLGSGISARSLTVTCKTGPDAYKKHFLGLSDNMTWFAEQLESKSVSVYHNRVVLKPQSIIPEIDLRVDGRELLRNRN